MTDRHTATIENLTGRRVAVIGTGYVGLTTGVCLAYLGHDVSCVDADPEKIATLEAGKTPIYEPHLTELLAESRSRLTFTTKYEDAVPGADDLLHGRFLILRVVKRNVGAIEVLR